MKEEKTKGKKKLLYYLILAISVALLVAATVLTVYFVTGETEIVEEPAGDGPVTVLPPEDNTPSGGTETKPFISPFEYTSAGNYGDMYTNAAGDTELSHDAVHLYAENGTEVCAMADGTVEVIDVEEDDAVLGHFVVISHGGGIKTLYRNIEVDPSLKVGQTVKQGDVIGKVDCTFGTESHEEPHLHLEMFRGEESIDPTSYLIGEYEEK